MVGNLELILKQAFVKVMESNLTFGSIAALFLVMAVLAAIPSVSVLIVSARSASCGFVHGVFTTLGIVVGDLFFILIAVFGLSLLAETMGDLFVLVKYIGGVYLIWLGVMLWRSNSKVVKAGEVRESSLLSSFLAGLFVTLGDQKAILFYLGFFPAFLDLSAISWPDAGIILTITIVAVGGVKLGYAYMAGRAGLLISSEVNRGINLIAGSALIVVGMFLMVKA